MININEFESMIKAASESKQGFINFIQSIEFGKMTEWIEKFWTDDMSKIFFTEFFSGSLDDEIIDDIEQCMLNAT